MTNKQDKASPGLIAPHRGYRNLKSYQNAEIVYDATGVGRAASLPLILGREIVVDLETALEQFREIANDLSGKQE